MKGFEYHVLDGIRDRHFLVDAYTPWPDGNVSPVGVDIGIYVLASLLIVLQNAVSDLLQYCNFTRQDCRKSPCEEFFEVILENLLFW